MMYLKDAKLSRQSPLQKAVGSGESALRVIGTGKAIWDAGEVVDGAAQAIAPYVASAVTLL